MEEYEKELGGSDETLNPYGWAAIGYYLAAGSLSLLALAHLIFTS